MPEGLKDIIFDLIIILILFVSIYRGYKRGFIKEFMAFLGLFVSLILSVRYMSDISSLLYGVIELPHSIVTLVSFLIIFIPIMLFFRWMAIKLKILSKFSFTLGSLDRLAGIVLGLIRGAIFVSVSIFVITLTGLSGLMREEVNKSQLFNPMKQVLPLAFSVTKVFVWEKYKSFYLEMKETLNADFRAVMDTNSEEVLKDYEGK